jgi:IS605 OrfB family transposase
MTRSSKHILKFQTDSKTAWLDKLFSDYLIDLQFYIDLIWNKQLPIEKNLSSKKLPANLIAHSQYKQILYKQASEIVRSNIEKRKTSKPVIENISINIDNRLFDIRTGNYFNEFIHLRLPYFYLNKKRARYIRLPIKHHKQSLKYKDWKRNNTIQLKMINNNYYVIFTYEKEIALKQEGKTIGIDQGYKKLIVTSENQIIGKDFIDMYEKIGHKKQGSKSFKRALVERDNKINHVLKKLNFSDIKQIVVEDLKNVKKNTRKRGFCKKFTNKFQRWTYTKVINRLQRLSEENGIQFTKIDPTYTSQTCSQCGFIHALNRHSEDFVCLNCGYKVDADYNASVNVLHRGTYNSSTEKELVLCQC